MALGFRPAAVHPALRRLTHLVDQPPTIAVDQGDLDEVVVRQAQPRHLCVQIKCHRLTAG